MLATVLRAQDDAFARLDSGRRGLATQNLWIVAIDKTGSPADAFIDESKGGEIEGWDRQTLPGHPAVAGLRQCSARSIPGRDISNACVESLNRGQHEGPGNGRCRRRQGRPRWRRGGLCAR